MWMISFAPAPSLVRVPALCRRPLFPVTIFEGCGDDAARGACSTAGKTYVSIVNCRKG